MAAETESRADSGSGRDGQGLASGEHRDDPLILSEAILGSSQLTATGAMTSRKGVSWLSGAKQRRAGRVGGSSWREGA
ncbi:hypothetical protein KUCAC02_031868 [Chaenocephalus aceratus]|nr:hypothetical protein KUCAC02_031868 [Chaenocephalus aceratus]